MCYAGYTLLPSAFGEIPELELHKTRLQVRLSTLLLWAFNPRGARAKRWCTYESENKACTLVKASPMYGGIKIFFFFFQKLRTTTNFFFIILFKYLQDFEHFTKNFTKIFPFSEFPLNFPIIFYKVICGCSFSNSKISGNAGWKKNLEIQTRVCPRVYMILVCDSRPFDSDITDH